MSNPDLSYSNFSFMHMPTDYLAFYLTITADEQRELAWALLADLPCNGFEETDTELVGYLATADATPATQQLVEDVAGQLAAPLRWATIPYENWNARWEAGFQPVRVGDFAGIRAAFHPPLAGVRFDLVIQPRMAFGTGHHATTYLMMEAMAKLPWPLPRVLDYGCGTGILAILARKLGAGEVHAVDIELESYLNTLDNAAANDVDQLQAYHGVLDDVPDTAPFALILANINRHVILESLPALYQRLAPGGRLLVSGILRDDVPLVRQHALEAGFSPLHEAAREQWMLLDFLRPRTAAE